MRISYKTLLMALSLSLSLCLTACSSDDPEPDNNSSNNSTGNNTSDNTGGYGNLSGNLITIGSTRDLSYTSCVLLGTVDFPKITSDHTYGIVYMEALLNPEFDYEGRLTYGGHSDRTDKEKFDCIDVQVRNSAADGKFEKQLINLKPATEYFYRAYVTIGQNVNYSDVKSFTTKDPTPEITMSTSEPTAIYAVAGTMNGGINIGNLQDVNSDQEYGFIYTTASQMSDPSKLTYEYYNEWMSNHFETEDMFPAPEEATTNTNMNGRISVPMTHLVPGVSYFYRTFFKWNNKYFYSPDVKTLTTHGTNEITVGTYKATDITSHSATLNATVPFSLIGLNHVEAGFLISKTYSNPSEFTMDEAVEWSERYAHPNENIYFVDLEINDKDFSFEIDGLSPETTYHVCAFINLGEYDDEELYVYGSMNSFMTGKASDDPIDPNDPTADFYIYSKGEYPWTQQGDSWISGNSGIHNSSSTLYIRVRHTAGQYLFFDMTVSSESNYDGVVNDNSLISGEISDNFYFQFDTDGITEVYIEYIKDGSNNAGNDCAIVSNFKLSDALPAKSAPVKIHSQQ